MEELKELVEVINTLPHLALWIIAGVTLYKVVVVGSIYGVIRYTVGKFVEWKTAPVTYQIGGALVNRVDVDRIEGAMKTMLTRISRINDSKYLGRSEVVAIEKYLMEGADKIAAEARGRGE